MRLCFIEKRLSGLKVFFATVDGCHGDCAKDVTVNGLEKLPFDNALWQIEFGDVKSVEGEDIPVRLA